MSRPAECPVGGQDALTEFARQVDALLVGGAAWRLEVSRGKEGALECTKLERVAGAQGEPRGEVLRAWPSRSQELVDAATQTPPGVTFGVSEPQVMVAERREQGRRARVPLDAQVEALRPQLEAAAPALGEAMGILLTRVGGVPFPPGAALRADGLRGPSQAPPRSPAPTPAPSPLPSPATTPSRRQAIPAPRPSAPGASVPRASTPKRASAAPKRPLPQPAAAPAEGEATAPTPFTKRRRQAQQEQEQQEAEGLPPAPRMLLAKVLPPGKAFPPDWGEFEAAYGVRLNPSWPTTSVTWVYLLARAYRKRCLDAARKRRKTGNHPAPVTPPAEVVWRHPERSAPAQTTSMEQLWEQVWRSARRYFADVPDPEAAAERPQPRVPRVHPSLLAPPPSSPVVRIESTEDPRLAGLPEAEEEEEVVVPPPASRSAPTQVVPSQAALRAARSGPTPATPGAARKPTALPPSKPAAKLRRPPAPTERPVVLRDIPPPFLTKEPLSPRSQYAQERLVGGPYDCDDEQRGTFLFLYEECMGWLQRTGRDPATEFRARYKQLRAGGAGGGLALWRGWRASLRKVEEEFSLHWGEWGPILYQEFEAQCHLAGQALEEEWQPEWATELLSRLLWEPETIAAGAPEAGGSGGGSAGPAEGAGAAGADAGGAGAGGGGAGARRAGAGARPVTTDWVPGGRARLVLAGARPEPPAAEGGAQPTEAAPTDDGAPEEDPAQPGQEGRAQGRESSADIFSEGGEEGPEEDTSTEGPAAEPLEDGPPADQAPDPQAAGETDPQAAEEALAVAPATGIA